MNRMFEDDEKRIRQMADEYLPEHMVGGFMRYMMDGIEPGSFLTALLSNDLMETVGLYNACPSASYGSPKLVSEWISMGGLNGMEREIERMKDEANAIFDQRDTKEPA